MQRRSVKVIVQSFRFLAAKKRFYYQLLQKNPALVHTSEFTKLLTKQGDAALYQPPIASKGNSRLDMETKASAASD
jgi:hypothetical protein